MNFRCGFVAVIGKPNVGKSTLVNHLIGQKISITSKKAQTTRHKINGIFNNENAQIIFTDTPGFQTKYRNAMNDRLNQNVIDTVNSVDLILFVVEAGRYNQDDDNILNRLPENMPVMLIVNKSDKIKDKLLVQQFIDEIQKKRNFVDNQIVCAKHGLNLQVLIDKIIFRLPENPPFYEDDIPTDKSVRFLVSEIIREKIFRHFGEELPYSVNVEIEQFAETDELAKIHAAVLVEKEGQKGILIGKGGGKLKNIATEARLDIEKLLDKKVFIRLFVKVKSGWADDIKFLNDLSV
ncbi:MAG: GTPase Era [Neisseriaceae bacterium]|nr:GTPase Era [Neisseriaceae bacterium]MBQ9723715.1 GTPase Era [Neisseriaceae bacterium]MBR1819461.1 GTPase Era [Neisseriaceae bacterium]